MLQTVLPSSVRVIAFIVKDLHYAFGIHLFVRFYRSPIFVVKNTNYAVKITIK